MMIKDTLLILSWQLQHCAFCGPLLSAILSVRGPSINGKKIRIYYLLNC